MLPASLAERIAIKKILVALTKPGAECALHISIFCTRRPWRIFLNWRRRMLPDKRIRGPIYFVLCMATMLTSAMAQEAADFFRQNCVSCHTVGGGRLTGPDLKNVTQRKER